MISSAGGSNDIPHLVNNLNFARSVIGIARIGYYLSVKLRKRCAIRCILSRPLLADEKGAMALEGA